MHRINMEGDSLLVYIYVSSYYPIVSYHIHHRDGSPLQLDAHPSDHSGPRKWRGGFAYGFRRTYEPEVDPGLDDVTGRNGQQSD